MNNNPDTITGQRGSLKAYLFRNLYILTICGEINKKI